VLLYLNEVQRNLSSELLSRYYGIAQPLYVARLQGIEYAWIYENKSYEAPMAYIRAHGDAETDAIVVSRRGLFTENYHDLFPVHVLKANWTQEQLQDTVQRIAGASRRVWYVRYAEKEPVDVLDWVDREWQEQSVLLEEHSFTDVTLSLLSLRE